MKIVVLSFTSDKISRGVETVVKELEKEWKKRHEVRVFSAMGLGMKVNWPKMMKGSSWRTLMLDYFHFKIFWFTVKALRKVKKGDVIVPVNGGWQTLLCRLYCWVRGVGLVVPGLAGLGWCDRWNLYMQPDVFVASTKRNAKWARRYNKRVRIEIAPHGVDLKRFKPNGKKMRLGLKPPTVLCVAAGEEYKRVRATIKAMVKMKEASLLLVGGNDDWEKLGKKLLGDRFKRMRVEYKDLDKVYRSVDAFTMVSESTEEFGIVNLEALACGLPVVATDDELRHELLGQFGIYVKNPDNTEEYAEKLRQALAHIKVPNLYIENRKKREEWLKSYQWSVIAKKYEEIFKVTV